MFIIYIFLPETPIWCVRTGRLDKARTMLRRLYRGVPDFDEDRFVQQLQTTLAHEKAVAIETRNDKWYAPLKGTNLVSVF